jgi:hypothetical protein
MLPVLRILPVGGVLLAILVLVLALSPPDASRSPLAAAIAPARGALVDRDRHPEVRQFLILAALKRDKELKSLRELPDTPTRSESTQVAGLPSNRSDTDPDETGTITETPGVTIPVEIGEPSSTELPISLQGESTPEVKNPERTKPQSENRRRVVHRTRHPKTMADATQRQFDLLEVLFGGKPYDQPVYSTRQASKQYQQPTYATPQATYATPQGSQ